MIRSFVIAVVAVCVLLAAPQAYARSLGGFSINTTGPITLTPHDPWGGKELCTAHLCKMNGTKCYEYWTASGYNYAGCMANVNAYLTSGSGWVQNPNVPGSLCDCHPGFNGMIVSGPRGIGPFDLQELTDEQVQAYDEGLRQLREKYKLDLFAEEYELLLQAIESDAPSDR